MTWVPRKATALAALTLAIGVGLGQGDARAQWGYPGGYGGYGWGGWGGGGGTVQGSIARGLGAYAAGAGYYNQQTAVANSINTDTVMRWNQYLYLSQMETNRRYHARLAERQLGNVNAHAEISKRLRDSPGASDIHNGDALNVALDEINHPAVYGKGLAGLKTKVGGKAIREIPFQHASEALTASVDDVVRGGPPPALQKPAFDSERGALKETVAAIRKQAEETKRHPDPALLKKAGEQILALKTKFEATVPKSDPGYPAGERFLKASYGLTRMLETPAVDVLLSGVEDRPDATLGDLLSFMNAFNLRFGTAQTPEQRMVYDTLYPLLDKARDEASPAVASAAAPTADKAAAGEFFNGMNFQEMKDKPPAPPAPAR